MSKTAEEKLIEKIAEILKIHPDPIKEGYEKHGSGFTVDGVTFKELSEIAKIFSSTHSSTIASLREENERLKKHLNWKDAFLRGKWVSVEESLPEISEETKFDFGYRSKPVIVLINGAPYITEYSFLPNRSKNGWCSINAPSQIVTHWMPLPEKP